MTCKKCKYHPSYLNFININFHFSISIKRWIVGPKQDDALDAGCFKPAGPETKIRVGTKS